MINLIKFRLTENEMEKRLLAIGFDIFDDSEEMLIDSTIVHDLASDFGFKLAILEDENETHVFTKKIKKYIR